MELVQKQVRYMQEKPSITDQFQMDEDYNVPDTKDDVKQIVRSKETVKIEDINLIENYLRVSGKLCFQILYIVDSEENRLASLEGKIPFEEMVYVTDMGKDEFFIKHVRTEFQSALIHSRKISLHAMIELEIGREQMQEEETTIDMESDVPVYKKVNRINLLGIQMNKNDTYRVKEEITLPGTKESIGQLLLSDISLRKLEIRLMQDELRLQGEFLVFIIYLSEEQKMDWLEQTVLFEGKLECSGIEEGMYDYINYALEDTLADVRLDEDGEMRVIGIEGTIHLRMNIYKEESIDVLADMYSLQKKCEFEWIVTHNFLIMPRQPHATHMMLTCQPVHIICDPVHNLKLACFPCNCICMSLACFLFFHRNIDLIISKNISAGTPDTKITVRSRINRIPSLCNQCIVTTFIFFLTAIMKFCHKYSVTDKFFLLTNDSKIVIH